MSYHSHSYSDKILCQEKSVSDETGWGECQEEALFLVLEFAGRWTGLPQNAAQLESFLALAQSLTCLQWLLAPFCSKCSIIYLLKLRHKLWHLCLCHTEFKYVLCSLLGRMACGLSEREIECKLKHMAATWVIPCELRGVIVFLTFVNFITFLCWLHSPLWTDYFVMQWGCSKFITSGSL